MTPEEVRKKRIEKLLELIVDDDDTPEDLLALIKSLAKERTSFDLQPFQLAGTAYLLPERTTFSRCGKQGEAGIICFPS